MRNRMNDLELYLEVVSRSRQPLRYILTLNISETVRDSGFVPKDHNMKWPMGYQMVTKPMTSRTLKGAVRQYGRLS